MKRTILSGLAGLACLAVLALAAPAKAMMIAPQPLPMRIVNADLVVVGKVIDFGPRLVPAERSKDDKGEYQIANVSVESVLKGKAGGMVKVAFIPPPVVVPSPVGPGGRPAIRPFIRFRGVTLAIGQEGCLLLTKHPTKDFYTIGGFGDVINKNGNANFARETDEIKRAAKLLANPKAGLESKDANDRLTTAAMLIQQYRSPRGGFAGPMPKTEPINAAESKLILQTLADAEWPAARVGFSQINPQNLFFRLGVTPKDGWIQPKGFKDVPAAAKKWLKDNAATYRIQRILPAAAAAGNPRLVPGPAIRIVPAPGK